MSVPDPVHLREAIRRGHLTPSEQAECEAYLRDFPEQRSAWEEDLSLNQLLRQMPDAQLASNFTARVLEAVHERQARPGVRASWGWLPAWSRGWVPRLAAVTAVLAIGLLTYQQSQSAARKRLANDMAEVLAAGTTLEVLQNFDAIQRLGQVPSDVDNDKKLIAALQ